MLPMAYCK